ncbi:MAG: flagellar hook-associated protein FlgL [Ignavibacteriales bacterium]
MNLRVTQSMMSRNMVKQINDSYRNLDRLQTQISTGKRINQPSDDPYGVSRVLHYNTKIKEIETFQRNVTEANNWLDMTDDAIMKSNELLIRAKELMVQGSQDSFGMKAREAIADELAQLKLNLGDIANTTYKGRYIFSGSDTDQAPFDGTNFTGANLDQRQLEVTQGSYLPINVAGKELFGYGGGLFTLIDQMVTDLRDPSKSGKDLTNYVTQLENQQDHFVAIQSTVGARVNRIEQARDRLDLQLVSFNKYLSEVDGVDMAKAITELTSQENIHKAALSAGSRVIQQTLVDFIR